MSVEILFLAFFSSVLHCKETEAGDSEGELPFDLNADSDQMKEDGLAYGQSLAMRTLGFGIGCSLVLGFVNFFVCLGCCCRDTCCQCCVGQREKLSKSINKVVPDQLRVMVPDSMGGYDLQEIPSSSPQRVNGQVLPAAAVPDVKDRKRKNAWTTNYGRRSFHFCSFFLFALMLICAGLNAQYTLDTRDVFDDSFNQGKTLIIESAEFSCSSNKELLTAINVQDIADVCDEHSIGDFLEDAEDVVGSIFDVAIETIEGFNEISVAVDEVLEEAINVPPFITSAKESLIDIDNATQRMYKDHGWLSNSSHTSGVDLSNQLPETSAFPSIRGEQFKTLTNMQRAMEDTIAAANDTANTMKKHIKTSTDFQYTLDGIEGNEVDGKDDMRIEAEKLKDEYRDFLIDVSLQALDYHSEAEDMHEQVQSYYPHFTIGVATFTFIPALVVLFSCCCSSMFKSRKPMCLAIAFMFLVQGIYGIIFGIMLTFAEVNSDLCDWHVELMDASLEKFGPEDTPFLGSVHEVLNCPAAVDGVTTKDNNLVDILGLYQYLNMTEVLDDSTSFLDDVNDQILEAVDQLREGLADIKGANDSVDVPFNFTVVLTPLERLKEDLPPEDFDRNKKSHQDHLISFYGDGDLSGFSFGYYSDKIWDMNGILSSYGVPNGYMSSYNNETIQNFTVEMLDKPEWLSYYPYPSQARASLLLVGEPLEISTNLLTKVIEANSLIHGFIDNFIENIETIETSLQNMVDVQNQILEAVILISQKLSNVLDVTLERVSDMESLTTIIYSVQDFAFTANAYTKCGFFGNFYRDFFLDTWCVDFTQNMQDIGIVIATIVFGMFFFHFLLACFIPVAYTTKK